MPTPRIIRIGYPGAVEQPIRYSWDSRTGFQTTRTWIGPYNSCIGLMPQLQANGWNFEMGSNSNGVNYTIAATIGYSWSGSGILDNPVDDWGITSTKVEKELLLSNNPHVAGCTATDIKTLQGYLSDPTNANFTDTNSLVKPVTAWRGLDGTTSTPLTTDGQSVATMLVSGIRSVSIIQPTIRHTQTVSNVFVIAAARANVGKILSTALMLQSVPAAIAAAVPSDPATAFLGAAFGWLVGPLDVDSSAFNKSKLVQDFVFGAYYTDLYGVPIPVA